VSDVKVFGELKAEPMTASRLDRWLSGKISRRLCMVPFGGPLPGGKAGLDIDGEYFDGTTDLYGPFPALRASRERLVDWHHDNDPTNVMKGAILGRVVFDANAEEDGVWADFWVNAGERRKALVAQLERRGVPLFGSSQAVHGFTRKAKDGHIEVWPVIRHTITTSPQNTYAVMPSLKAMLSADLPLDMVTLRALHAAILGLDTPATVAVTSATTGLTPDASHGELAAKAGRVVSARTLASLRAALDELVAWVATLNEKDNPPPQE